MVMFAGVGIIGALASILASVLVPPVDLGEESDAAPASGPAPTITDPDVHDRDGAGRPSRRDGGAAAGPRAGAAGRRRADRPSRTVGRQIGTAVPDTRTPSSPGAIDTVIRLGRPISTPWLISNVAGATISPRSRRYAPRAAAGGARRRVLDDAADRERIARPEPVGCLAPDELERRQVGVEHQRLERLERVVEARQPRRVASRQDEVPGTGEADRRRERRVELGALPSEQLQRAGEELGAGLAHPRSRPTSGWPGRRPSRPVRS